MRNLTLLFCFCLFSNLFCVFPISNPISSNPFSLNPISSNPISPNPISSNPISPKPISSNPISLNHVFVESDFVKSDFVKSDFVESDFESDFGFDNPISLSYSVAAFNVNLFGLFLEFFLNIIIF